ncbi:hypothetical protein [Nostoc linckia]|uniref:hypothetical protein n=1 Tax=Nostoc linckia TaxID=92942 RepID=UPI00117F2A3B|nr:hypothetical protein [Nostoc linckia]
MSGKLLVICHCECNEVEGRNRKNSAITSLRYRYVPCGNAKGERNDKHLAGLDITHKPKGAEKTLEKLCVPLRFP